MTAEEAGKTMILDERDAFNQWYANLKVTEELNRKKQ